METVARNYQQQYYELLPDWFEYNQCEYKYIEQQIGFALFGPPDINTDREDSIVNSSDIFSKVKYNNDSCKCISSIHQKILKYGEQKSTKRIYMAIIYNVIFNHESPVKFTNDSNEKSNEIFAFPVFKIKRDISVVWYIDNNARVYKSWEDYLKNNELPKCLMVVPKDGVYQCNPSYNITQHSSTVWIQILQSPSCSTIKTVVKSIDIASNVLSLGTAVGLTAAAAFTPIGPVLASAGLVSCGLSGLWNVARSSQKLVDLNSHEGSISPANKNALSAWIGITGSALTIGANGGTMFLSQAVAKGTQISTAAKLAYNAVVIGNLTVNGAGVVYQGCCLISKYKKTKTVDPFDIVMFSSHILFFSNSIVNTKLAGELIGTSNGTVLEKFKGISSLNTKTWQNSLQIMSENGKLLINGITLLDPLLVTEQLLTIGAIALTGSNSLSSLINSRTMAALKTLLSTLLRNYYSERQHEVPHINDFHQILEEMTHMDNAVDILKMVFQIGVTLITFDKEPSKILHKVIFFVWEYCKANLKQRAMNACSPFKGSTAVYSLLAKIVTNVFRLLDMLRDDLYSAFNSYMLYREPWNTL
ncbi:hypothetical protein WN55_04563 [Dufourea novaeangliae]|uniref:DUF4781 domain-containing protein n=2 Tax=Dufourea novaeangliae TaxID=178035 RepID=A0A154P1B1_DUFNO|nr:hypothetical protein WN55_04563 [Dufourea novaeangliae]